MPNYMAPGVYMEEVSSGNRPITPASTSVAAFIGVAQKGPVNRATLVTNFSEFVKLFGGALKIITSEQEHYLYYAVRHFFEQGGGRCYVVRVIPNLGDPATDSNAADSAEFGFDGERLDKSLGTPATVPVTDALVVRAINPGAWGDALSAQLVNTSPFSVLLAADAATGDTNLLLQENTDVRAGTLLWVVKEVSGTVASVNEATNTISMAAGMTEFETPPPALPAVPTPYADDIGHGMAVFDPAFEFFERTNFDPPTTVLSVDPAADTSGIVLTGVRKIDGSLLRPGDPLNIAVTEEIVVVDRVTRTAPGTAPAGRLAHLASTDPGAAIDRQLVNSFPAAGSRVYARDFTLQVRLDEEIIETHENLSLVDANLANHVIARLGADSGNSFYIEATDSAAHPDDVQFNNSGFQSLTGGVDGLVGGNLDAAIIGDPLAKTGLYALDKATDASILCIPNASQAVSGSALAYCENRKDLFYVFEQPSTDTDDIATYRGHFGSQYAAIYHPWIQVADPLTGRPVTVPPCGAVAGIYARTDGLRGVHKAAAGFSTGKVTVAKGLAETVSKGQYDLLYPQGINAIRSIPAVGFHVWGGRTISPDPEWIYVNVRRLFIFLEQSILRATNWATFEPNDPTLWKSLEASVSSFLRIQWREGKLVGQREEEAFFVKCDEETNPPEVVDAGQVITLIGAAPSKPAEFVIFRIQQLAGQTAG